VQIGSRNYNVLMPELPEVETIVRNYGPLVCGRRVVAFASRCKKNCAPSAAAVRRGVVGRRIAKVTRRAKYIVMHLDDGAFLLVHLRMSGRFAWAADHARTPSHVRAVWEFERGDRLLFCDSRKFGRITLTRDLAGATAGLGVEPLEERFTAAVLGGELRRRSRRIKPLLLDQSIVAGLGNIYADEALHRARVHPERPSDSLDRLEIARLHRSIRAVLREGIRKNGTTIDWIYPGGNMQQSLRVYGRTGEPCRRCGAPIVALRVAQRGTHICPACQKARNGAEPQRRRGSTQ
jgi:formamidopyrimidine-DNA glycosylase